MRLCIKEHQHFPDIMESVICQEHCIFSFGQINKPSAFEEFFKVGLWISQRHSFTRLSHCFLHVWDYSIRLSVPLPFSSLHLHYPRHIHTHTQGQALLSSCTLKLHSELEYRYSKAGVFAESPLSLLYQPKPTLSSLTCF